jgi:DNA-binding transcriptional regulator YdaS (Cro superfamily)
MSLRTYVSAERGRCAQLARSIGVHPVLVSQWAGGKREVPIEHCAAIEQATAGAVTRQALRPEDWRRIWPELVTAAHPAPQLAVEVRDAA